VKEIDLNDTEIIRRVLTSLLDRLDEGSPPRLAQPDSGPNEPESAGAEPGRASRIEDRAAHPGLEKFSITEARHMDSAPRTCFMEPGRVCVNSGACEMRGY
jgi:hypothetical protein